MGSPALNEFQSWLARRLAEHFPPSVERSWIDAAVFGATRDHFTAKYNLYLFRDAEGHVWNGMDPATGELVREPHTDVLGIEVSARWVRDLMPEEITSRETASRAYWWKPEDGAPPQGVTTLQLLEQKTWWRPRNEEPIELVDMRPTHRAHLLTFLRRNALRYKQAAEWEFIRLASGPLGPSGDMAQDGCDAALDELTSQTPTDWINGQPLVKRLAKLVKRDAKRFHRDMADRGLSPEEHCIDCRARLDSDIHHDLCEIPRAERIRIQEIEAERAKAELRRELPGAEDT